LQGGSKAPPLRGGLGGKASPRLGAGGAPRGYGGKALGVNAGTAEGASPNIIIGPRKGAVQAAAGNKQIF
jgi:hypothetical protein